MVRNLPFTAGLTALIVFVLIHETCSTEDNQHCASSSCGNIQNISHPFRLKSDPQTCIGVICYVQLIDYNNSTIRVVDSGIQKGNYFSTPSYSLYPYNFSSRRTALSNYNSRIVVFMSCEKPVNTPFYLDTLLAKKMESILPTLQFLITRGINMLQLVQ